MTYKKMSVNVKGIKGSYQFDVYEDDEFLEEYQADGLDIHIIKGEVASTNVEVLDVLGMMRNTDD